MNRTLDKLPKGWGGLTYDFSSDQRVFKGMPWGKAMMWIFLLSDTFIFMCVLISYMTVRASTASSWPDASIVFGLDVFGTSVPLLARGRPAPTTPLAPRNPIFISTKCMEPPLPRQQPASLPYSSAMSVFGEPPLARK